MELCACAHRKVYTRLEGGESPVTPGKCRPWHSDGSKRQLGIILKGFIIPYKRASSFHTVSYLQGNQFFPPNLRLFLSYILQHKAVKPNESFSENSAAGNCSFMSVKFEKGSTKENEAQEPAIKSQKDHQHNHSSRKRRKKVK